jgi:cellulose synthase/poly-beta-1,6-N-acetylglucosamine synthase-like glycosyltransferase
MATGRALILGVNPYNTPPSIKSRSWSFKPEKGSFFNIGYILYELLVLIFFYLGGYTWLLSMLPSYLRLISLLGLIRAPKLVYYIIPTLLDSIGYFHIPGLSFYRGLLRFYTLPGRRRVLGYSRHYPTFGT